MMIQISECYGKFEICKTKHNESSHQRKFPKTTDNIVTKGSISTSATLIVTAARRTVDLKTVVVVGGLYGKIENCQVGKQKSRITFQENNPFQVVNFEVFENCIKSLLTKKF